MFLRADVLNNSDKQEDVDTKLICQQETLKLNKGNVYNYADAKLFG